MIAFMKKMFGNRHKENDSHVSEREALKREVKKGSEEAVKRYKGVLEKLAEYDRV